jgi:cytochrome P450/glutathione S-transferase
MPYSVFYRHRPHRMISYGVSPYAELARWVMDRRGAEYREESHVPLLHFLVVRQKDELPGLVVPEGLLPNARAILDYWEARSTCAERLIPDGDPEIGPLLDRFYWKTGMAVRRWAYSYVLPERAPMLRTWKRGAPLWERAVATMFYPVMKWIMTKGIQITPTAAAESMVEIDDAFAMVADRLKDGRRYLTGDRLTAADVAFAALTGPALFPDGYAGALPTLDELPAAMRADVLRLRETPAGQFTLRLYREDRGHPWTDGVKPSTGIAAFFTQLFSAIAFNPGVLRLAFAILRRFKPVLVAGKTALVARHADVVDAFERDTEFTIAEINGARMDRMHAPFILGWDRSPQYEREAGILRRAMGPPDLATIRAIVAREAKALVDAAGKGGRLDVVTGLSRVVPTRVVAEFFGTPGSNEQAMMRWLRVLFYEVFLNRSDVPEISQAAAGYADQLRDYLNALIARRKAELAAGTPGPDDFLTRLLRMQSGPGDSLDDDGVRRNVTGLIVGAVDTTSAALTQAMDVLLSRREELAKAQAAAKAGDAATVLQYVLEALRYNPQAPGLLRYCRNDTTVGGVKIPAGSTALLGTLSAMFDPAVFADPGMFRVDRPLAAYLHFGHGMHTCYGRPINLVQLPELAMALLRKDGLRRARGSAGRIVYDGPFPDRLVVEFDA